MQFVGKLVTSVSDFYRDLNPATLTGAMDVIVVEDSVSRERACTPFHVRIGKLNLMRPQDKRVEVQVNGEVVDKVEMKVGEAGEAFFVVPEEDILVAAGVDSGGEDDLSVLSTSPLPPPPLSPVKTTTGTTAVDDFTLSPKKDANIANSNNNSNSTTGTARPTLSDSSPLSDTELDYSTNSTSNNNIRYERWLDIFEYATKEDRVRAQIADLNQSLNATVDDGHIGGPSLALYHITWPLKVYPPRDYPMIIEHTAKSSTRLTVNDLPIYFSDPTRYKHLLLSVSLGDDDDGKWWFGGRQAAIMAVCLGTFRQTPDVTVFKDLLFPPPIKSTTSATTNTNNGHSDAANNNSNNNKGQTSASTAAPSSWRHWWSRAAPDAAAAAAVTATPPSNTATVTAPIPIPAATTQSPIVQQQTADNTTTNNSNTNNNNTNAKKRYLKSLRLTNDQLQSLPLKPGPNSITFTFATGRSCQSRIFLWPSDARIVISDIDGTITKSDALGHILTFVGKDWTHSGVAGLFDRIHKNGYMFLYLTARAIGQAGSTRDYLRGIEQDKCQLPEGPVIMSPDRLLAALRREVIVGNPEEFKIACLKDIKRLFNKADPFYAGFGNRFTDAQSYHAVGIPAHRIFTVEPGGQLRVEHGLGYDSTYGRMLDVADLFFPPLAPSLPHTNPATNTTPLPHSQSNPEDFQDFNFWRLPVQPVDDLAAFLPPPQSTAVIAGDNVIIIEHDNDDDNQDDHQETISSDDDDDTSSQGSASGQASLMDSQPGDKEYPFM